MSDLRVFLSEIEIKKVFLIFIFSSIFSFTYFFYDHIDRPSNFMNIAIETDYKTIQEKNIYYEKGIEYNQLSLNKINIKDFKYLTKIEYYYLHFSDSLETYVKKHDFDNFFDMKMLGIFLFLFMMGFSSFVKKMLSMIIIYNIIIHSESFVSSVFPIDSVVISIFLLSFFLINFYLIYFGIFVLTPFEIRNYGNIKTLKMLKSFSFAFFALFPLITILSYSINQIPFYTITSIDNLYSDSKDSDYSFRFYGEITKKTNIQPPSFSGYVIKYSNKTNKKLTTNIKLSCLNCLNYIKKSSIKNEKVVYDGLKIKNASLSTTNWIFLFSLFFLTNLIYKSIAYARNIPFIYYIFSSFFYFFLHGLIYLEKKYESKVLFENEIPNIDLFIRKIKKSNIANIELLFNKTLKDLKNEDNKLIIQYKLILINEIVNITKENKYIIKFFKETRDLGLFSEEKEAWKFFEIISHNKIFTLYFYINYQLNFNPDLWVKLFKSYNHTRLIKATEYPRITDRYFFRKDINQFIINNLN